MILYRINSNVYSSIENKPKSKKLGVKREE